METWLTNGLDWSEILGVMRSDGTGYVRVG